jgi:hypothetical protein
MKMSTFPQPTFLFREHPHNLYKFLYHLKDCQVIGMDIKAEEIIQVKLPTFRCNIAFIFGYKLFIIENKYHSDRTKQHLEALVCNRFRQYSPRKLNYLEGKFPDYYARLQEVILLVLRL